MNDRPQTTPAHRLMMAVHRLRRVLEAHTAHEIAGSMTDTIADRITDDLNRGYELMKVIHETIQEKR